MCDVTAVIVHMHRGRDTNLTEILKWSGGADKSWNMQHDFAVMSSALMIVHMYRGSRNYVYTCANMNQSQGTCTCIAHACASLHSDLSGVDMIWKACCTPHDLLHLQVISWPHMDEPRCTCKCVMSHVCMRCTYKSSHDPQVIMVMTNGITPTRVWMRHVTRMDASCDAYVCVTPKSCCAVQQSHSYVRHDSCACKTSACCNTQMLHMLSTRKSYTCYHAQVWLRIGLIRIDLIRIDLLRIDLKDASRTCAAVTASDACHDSCIRVVSQTHIPYTHIPYTTLIAWCNWRIYVTWLIHVCHDSFTRCRNR